MIATQLLESSFIYLLLQSVLFSLYFFFIFENAESKIRIIASILVPFPIALIIAFIYFIFIRYICSQEEI